MKHRKNKNGGQRIVVFVGSPLETTDSSELKALGTQLRRNNIGLDIIGIGENDGNASGFQVLIDAANKDGNSRLLMVPAGVLPSEMLSASPIMMGELMEGGGGAGGAAGGAGGAGGGGGAGGAGRFAEYGGIDPSVDPEGAEAMRLSLEEARAAQSREEAAVTASSAPAPAGVVAAGSMAVDGDLTDEDALLQQALALSMNDGAPSAAASPPASSSSSSSSAAPSTPAPAPAPVSAPPAPSGAAAPAAGDAAFSNPEFIQSVLANMDGVDMDDPELQAAIAAALGGSTGAGGAEGKDGERKDGEEKK